ncbi:uncharacterized protein LOC107514413 isoform X2 [Rousettus aegyptiacus]|uniref:uncharacterized protein LOC107514413 isoform X2 n=1 Tax=Rousettus aegyptiacus TaxID=9407 RepID=UPI00168D293C|nr:uncharacterized protein LOC107514413 isoform X2 [Rousettus aegyptiacus]
MEVRSNVGIIREYVRTPRRGRGLGFLPPRRKGSTEGWIRCCCCPLFARAQCEPSPTLLSTPTWNSAPRGKQYCSYSVRWLRQTSQRCWSGCELPIQSRPEPTIHVDAFLYDEDFIDSLCEEGKMSRNYCTVCGSHQTAPLGFISHSFSLMELKFIYHHVLPDLSGKVLVDVGSRLGTVLYGGYLYSSALQLYGVELNGDFCQLQEMIIKKYQFTDRVKVLHADICTQGSLLQNADVVIMNNVFEYFLDEAEQARAWEYISHNIRKQGSLLLTVPSLEESLSGLQINIQLSPWVEEVPLNYDVFPEKDIDREALEQIHLYKIL